MHTLIEENYLKAMFHLSLDNGEVSVQQLSKQLGIKMPTVTSMMKKLAEKKLVRYETYKPIRLTEKGKKEAALIIRKHRLTEMFLVEKMGFGWEQVHEIAEQMEHIKSPEFFARMDELLGYPVVDPHGSPIPDKQGKMLSRPLVKLSECMIGCKVKIAGVLHTSTDFLMYLNRQEIQIGTQLMVMEMELFDRSLVLQTNSKKTFTISREASERLLVDVIGNKR